MGMIIILEALLPIFLLILLGRAMRQRLLPDPAFWQGTERLTYYVLLPALMVTNLAEARLDQLPVSRVAGAQALAILALALAGSMVLVMAKRREATLDGPTLSSLFQGLVRPNTYVGLAAAAGLFGSTGLTIATICIALAVPLVNLLAVLALDFWTRRDGRDHRGAWQIVGTILGNPLILACLLGMGLNALDFRLPLVWPLFKILGQASLALGLLAVGAGLHFEAGRLPHRAILGILAGKHLLLPALVGGIAWTLGLTGLPLAVSIAYGGLPVSPSSYVLARQMGGNAPLMSAIITLSTGLAALTLPLVVLISGVLP